MCPHPSFSPERIEVMGNSYKTDDYLCDACGETFSQKVVAEIEAERERSS